jgi:hypothetical protein
MLTYQQIVECDDSITLKESMLINFPELVSRTKPPYPPIDYHELKADDNLYFKLFHLDK